jgi:short-subunit dehydrogenase
MADQQIAIVTGASRGIGKAIALGLAEKGYKTILISRNEDKLKEVAHDIISKIKDNSPHPDIIAFDLADVENIDGFIKRIKNEYGRIDVLINNAASYINGTFESSIDEFRQLIEMNLISAHELMKSVVPVMKDQKSGHIINIASRAGKIGFATTGMYSASKFALVGISESVYREYADDGIKVTAICPSWVDTEMAREAGSVLEPQEMIQTEDISKTVNYLLDISSSASIKDIMIECRTRIM